LRMIYTVELYADLPDDDEFHLDAMTGVIQDAALLMLTQAHMLTAHRENRPPTVRLLVADAISGEREIALEEGLEGGRVRPCVGPVRH
jgi:hypothetical protein